MGPESSVCDLLPILSWASPSSEVEGGENGREHGWRNRIRGEVVVIADVSREDREQLAFWAACRIATDSGVSIEEAAPCALMLSDDQMADICRDSQCAHNALQSGWWLRPWRRVQQELATEEGRALVWLQQVLARALEACAARGLRFRDVVVGQEKDAAPQLVEIERLMPSLLLKTPARFKDILHARVLSDEKATLEQVGARYGITRERVRQIQERGSHLVRKRIASEVGAVAESFLKRVKQQCGGALRKKKLYQMMTMDSCDDPGAALNFVMWLLEKEFDSQGEWVLSREIVEFEKQLLHLMESQYPNGMLVEDLRAGLRLRAVMDSEMLPWIERLPWLRRLDKHVVLWPSSLNDKAALLLRLEGRPMSAEDLLNAMDRPYSKAGLRNRLGGDPRFKRVQPAEYALRDMPGDEYRSIRHAIKVELERAGGVLSITDLECLVTNRFQVAPGSVRVYADRYPFVTEEGIVRIEEGSRPKVRMQHLRDTRSVYRMPGGWCCRVRVSETLLRGGSVPIPQSFAQYVGARPGREVVVTVGKREARVYWSDNGTMLSSLRLELRARDLVENDWVFIVCRQPRVLSVRALPAQTLEETTGPERLALLCGAPEVVAKRSDVLRRIAVRLGADQDGDPAVVLPERLRARKESQFLQFLVV